MATREGRTAWSSWIPLAAAMLAFPLAGPAWGEEPAANLATALKPGSTVSVTQWSGRKTEGEVIEVTKCAVVVRVASNPVLVPFDAIKTVKQHDPKKTNRAAKVMTDIANYCNEPGCAPGALMYLGVAGLIKSFDDMARMPKVIYRAKKRRARAGSCDMDGSLSNAASVQANNAHPTSLEANQD